jgi:hypothetical protein
MGIWPAQKLRLSAPVRPEDRPTVVQIPRSLSEWMEEIVSSSHIGDLTAQDWRKGEGRSRCLTYYNDGMVWYGTYSSFNLPWLRVQV